MSYDTDVKNKIVHEDELNQNQKEEWIRIVISARSTKILQVE